MTAKERAKRLIGERGRGQVRRLGRLRYINKSRRARELGWTFREHPRGWLRHVVLSPEVDSFSYEMANEPELAATLADLLGRSQAEVQAALDELAQDPEMTTRIAGDLGWRALYLRRRPPLPGHHRTMWVATRLLKPRIVVETGVLEGLGSRTILRALDRNGEEGHEGRLVSFDTMVTAGTYVPERLKTRWEPIVAPAPQGVEAHLGHEQVDIYLHDSLPTAEQQRVEWEWGLDHGAKLCVSSQGWTGLHDVMAAERPGVRGRVHDDVSRDHFYPGRRVAFLSRLAA